MKCTDCGRVVRPVVACDIDGTLGDYHYHFGIFLFDYWDRHWTSHPEQPWDGAGEFEEYLGVTKEQYRQAKLAYRQGGMKRTMPKFDGVDTLFSSLHEAGVEIWVATTRPYQRLDNIDPDTREWLRRNKLHVDGLLFGEDKYSQLAETVHPERVIGVIDDLSYQLSYAAALEMPTWQVARPHNSGPGLKWDPRGSLVDARKWVLNNLEEWRAKNEK